MLIRRDNVVLVRIQLKDLDLVYYIECLKQNVLGTGCIVERYRRRLKKKLRSL